MQDPIRRIVIQQYKIASGSVYLEARVDDDGSLNLEGQDIGPAVEKHWGDSD